MKIDARNLAAALSYEGADVESALLDLVTTSPTLNAKVRAALYIHNELPKLRYLEDRYSASLRFINTTQPRWTCIMHAVDAICRVIDDASIVAYLQAKFPEYNLEVLIERGL